MLLIPEHDVNAQMNWPEIVDAIQQSLLQIHDESGNSVPQRTIMSIPENNGVFLSWPAYGKLQNIITCKLMSFYSDNEKKFGIPTQNGCIVVFNGENGIPMANIEAGSVTAWKTAAGSIVAAKHLLSDIREFYQYKTLAVLGAGQQAKSHILGFQQIFNFGQIKLWNRTPHRRGVLATELKEKHQIQVEECETTKSCVQNADVIILTFAYCEGQFIPLLDLKPGALVIVIGYSKSGCVFGLCDDVYKSAVLYTERVGAIEREMKAGVERLGLKFENIGTAIKSGRIGVDLGTKEVILYQSIGNALMDTAAKLVMDKYIEAKI